MGTFLRTKIGGVASNEKGVLTPPRAGPPAKAGDNGLGPKPRAQKIPFSLEVTKRISGKIRRYLKTSRAAALQPLGNIAWEYSQLAGGVAALKTNRDIESW